MLDEQPASAERALSTSSRRHTAFVSPLLQRGLCQPRALLRPVPAFLGQPLRFKDERELTSLACERPEREGDMGLRSPRNYLNRDAASLSALPIFSHAASIPMRKSSQALSLAD